MITSKTLLISLLGTGCMAAAGVGGYIAVRTGSAESGTPLMAAAPMDPAVEPVQLAPMAEAPLPPPAAAVAEPRRAAQPIARPATRVSASRPGSVSRADEAAPPPAPGAGTAPVPALPVAEETPAPPASEAAVVAAAPPRGETTREVTIPADAVIGIRLDTPVSSETARVEDRVTARVTRDVTLDGVTAIPAGARLDGVVTLVERGGKFREKARIGIQFNSVTLGSNERLPIHTETIFRDGQAPGGEATSKIGASAVVGTILGAVIGGKKGAAIGGTAGAAGGTAVVMAGDRNEAVIPAGTPLTVRLTTPVVMSVARD